MKIRMMVDIPLSNLRTVVSCLEKSKCVMKGTNFIADGDVKKRKKFLTEAERKQVAALKTKDRGAAVQIAEQFGVTAGVVRKIWR